MKMNDDEKDLPQGEGEGGEEGGVGGAGGQTGEVHFRYKDVMSVDPRDDALPQEQINQIYAAHKNWHKGLVDKQKQTRKERAAAKLGKTHYSANNYGVGQGNAANNFKQHPLSQKAQFSGRDKQITGIPTLNEANTNDGMKNDLEYRLNYRPGQKFNPRPQMH